MSDSWTNVPATYTLWPAAEMHDGGAFGCLNFVSYHVGNKRKTCSNRTFCDKGPYAKVGNV